MSSTAVPRCIVCNSAVAIAAKRRVIHPCSEVNADVHEFFVRVVFPGYRFESKSGVSYLCRAPCFSSLEKAVKHHVALQGLLHSLRDHQLVPQPPGQESEPTTSDHGGHSLPPSSLQKSCRKDEVVSSGIFIILPS